MSRVEQDPLAIVRRQTDAAESGDRETARALYSPDVVLEAAAELGPEHGVFRGVREVAAYFGRWFAAFPDLTANLDDFRRHGSHVSAVGRLAGSSTAGVPTEGAPFGMVWSVRDGVIVRVQMTRDPDEARAIAERLVHEGEPAPEAAPPAAPPVGRIGTVYLVGAGPGDPGLMTARSLDLIARADAIVHDRLIPDGALTGARADAELIYAGKDPDGGSTPQAEIEARMIELARAGRMVVRLKGGDPFVFGRGGEEAQALSAAGIPFEVVPGVTAGVAAPAYAGIPVTHRDDASAVAFVTGHEDPARDGSALDWDALGRFPGTLVFYMGVRRLPEITERLVSAGRAADQAAAIVERGTLPGQRTVSATLGTLAAAASEADVRSPAITVIGDVAALRDRIEWLEHRPLHGRTVVVTRARTRASGLAARLQDLGAEVVEAPAIRIEPRPVEGELAALLGSIGGFALVCVTSPTGAELLLDGLAARGRDARSLAGVTVAAIGPATAEALRARGVRADVVPDKAVAEELVAALGSFDVARRRVLVVRPAEARDVLPTALHERGANVETAVLYETVPEPLSEAVLERVGRADYVTFTSGSTVRSLVAALGEPGLPTVPRVVSIGPVTSAAARAAGLEVHVEASRHDTRGLVEALLRDAGGRT